MPWRRGGKQEVTSTRHASPCPALALEARARWAMGCLESARVYAEPLHPPGRSGCARKQRHVSVLNTHPQQIQTSPDRGDVF